MCLPFSSSQTNYPSLFGWHTIMNRILQTHYFLSHPCHNPLSLPLSLSPSFCFLHALFLLGFFFQQIRVTEFPNQMDVVKPPPFTLALRNQSCSRDPVPIHSPGVWDMEEMKSFLGFALPRLQLQLAVIFLLTQSLYLLLKRFHLPRVASEIMVYIHTYMI